MNSRAGQRVASAVELALTRSARRRGLLHRTALDPAAALLLAPCAAVHTAFMRFAIDVIFVDRAGRVRRIVRRLQPWRIAASRHAYATVEMAAGALDSRDVAVGDHLYLETTDGPGADVDAAPASSRFADSLRRAAENPACCGS
jgi:uncharacterized membrane protein (UPF0127 family)